MSLSLRARAVCVAVVIAGLLGACVAASPASADLATLSTQSLRAFIDDSYGILMRRDPDSLWDSEGKLAATYGVERYAEMTDLSPSGLEETRRVETEILRLLRTFDRAKLSAEEQISYDAYEWLLEDRIAAGAYPLWDVGVGPSTYGIETRQLQLFTVLPVRDADDARDYVTRLQATATWVDQLLAGLRAREAAGVVPTLYVLQQAELDLTLGVLQEDAGDPDPRMAEAYTTFADRLADLFLEDEEETALLNDAAAAIRDDVFPAYRALRDYLAELQSRATSDVGVSGYPGGATYCAQVLHHYVGTGASAEELHALGLREVARIDAELRAAASAGFGWPSDLPMAELTARIDAAKSTRSEGEELQAEYCRLLAEAQAPLSAYFGLLPSVGLEWRIDPLGPPAYYQAVPLDRSAPAYFVVSLANPALGTMYDEAALVYHETVPGHHLQFGVAVGLDLPAFQRIPAAPLGVQHPDFQAFTEGWALYSEHAAAEMGLYADNPVGNLWRLRLELTQMVRLVADTGMNALGWTWADAAAYLEGALGVKQRQSGLLRYESAHGQSCGYNVGYITLLELRRRAEERLGAAFDVREFHSAVLGHGALPLEILERVVDEWIAAKAGEL